MNRRGHCHACLHTLYSSSAIGTANWYESCREFVQRQSTSLPQFINSPLPDRHKFLNVATRVNRHPNNDQRGYSRPPHRDLDWWPVKRCGCQRQPKSTGGKQELGATSKMGERTLRRLLIIGSSAVVKQASKRGAPKGSWLEQMLARKPRMLVTVAIANRWRGSFGRCL